MPFILLQTNDSPALDLMRSTLPNDHGFGSVMTRRQCDLETRKSPTANPQPGFWDYHQWARF